MNNSLWVAKTGLDAQQTRMSVIANNLANVNTTGFKKSNAVFEDLIYQNLRQAGGQTSQQTRSATGLEIGTGSRLVATERDFTQGTLSQTDNALDVAINGRGFLQILLPDGTQAYTRDGSLQLDAEGNLVTAGGYAVLPGINVPIEAQSLIIGQDGVVSVQTPGAAAPQEVGNLTLADFVNPGGLAARGENLLLETAASGPAQIGAPGANGLGTVRQGALESSNVNVVEELVDMIETQRAYELNSKAIETSDQMLSYVNNNL
nr:flagellar basal-body rod protein FlgG [Oceanococcus sp. HetDA_MAG_MS8]